MDINRLIIGENFKDISSIHINFTNFQEKREYQKNNIVFCKTDLVLHFFNEIRGLDINIILITHQSDYEVNNREPNFDPFGNLTINWSQPSDGHTPALFRLKPPQVKKWFAQNVNYNHPDLIPIPIGLENHHGPSRGGSIDPDYIKSIGDINIDSLNSKSDKIIDKIYVNFGDTHVNRKNVRDFLLLNDFSEKEDQKLVFGDYLEKMSKFLFVASPRGNGIDTHRTWETLYMGSIPIVEKHFMYDTYELPIWQIENWEELKDSSKFQYWIDRYKSGKLFENVDQLFMDYWRSKIVREFENLK